LPRPEDDDREEKIASALSIWRESDDPRGTIVETYLRSRGLDLDADIAGKALRWNARLGAMVALFRDIRTDEPLGLSRTFLGRDGKKLGRKFLGPVGGTAIKLDADDAVTHGLFVAEGIETALAARQIGLRPIWAAGSCTAIANFPVLPGIEALSILRERDDANARAAIACGTRWHSAGKDVLDVWPNVGNDVADSVAGGRVA
jgi:hypothetical protein